MRRECTADESLQTVQEAFQLLRPLAMQPGSSAVQVREVFDVARTLLRSSRVASPTHVDAFAVVRTCAARIEQMLAAGEPQVVDNPFQLYLEQSQPTCGGSTRRSGATAGRRSCGRPRSS